MILIADGIVLVGVLIAFAVNIGISEFIIVSTASGSLESAIFN